MAGEKRHRKSKKKKSKKKKKIPWYLQEEIMKEKEEKARQEREAEEARRKMEEEQRWYESLSPAEKEQVDCKRTTETRRAFWHQFYESKNDEEENRRRKEAEIKTMQERRRQEKLERQRLAEKGELELDKGNILIERCNTCEKVVYKHEQIAVGNKVFHKLGCFKCFFCNMPLKLWNYKVLESRFYCTPHYEQFYAKIMTKKLLDNQKKAFEDEQRKLELQRIEEERIAREKAEEEERLKRKREEDAALAERQKELERQAEEMRKLLEAEDKGEPLPPPPLESTESTPIESTTKESTENESTPEGDSKAKKTMNRSVSVVAQLIAANERLAGKEVSSEDSDSEDEDESSSEDVEEEEEEDAALQKLFEAAKSGNLEEVTELLEKGSLNTTTTNNKGETILHAAVLSNNVALINFLIEKGANPLVKSTSNDLPLHIICNSPIDSNPEKAKASEEIIKILVEYPGVNVDEPDNNNNTPLILASSRGRVETVRTLIKHNADVRPRNNIGATCLHAAADGGQVEVAKQLMNVQRMDVDMQDDQGYTPLHLAVMANHANMTKLLLALGASITIADKFHQHTPLDEARTPELRQLFHLFAHKKQTPIGFNTPPPKALTSTSDGAVPKLGLDSLKPATPKEGKVSTPRKLINKFFDKDEKKEEKKEEKEAHHHHHNNRKSWFGTIKGKKTEDHHKPTVPVDSVEIKENEEETKKRLENTKEFWRTLSSNSLQQQQINQKGGGKHATLKKRTGNTPGTLPSGFKKVTDQDKEEKTEKSDKKEKKDKKAEKKEQRAKEKEEHRKAKEERKLARSKERKEKKELKQNLKELKKKKKMVLINSEDTESESEDEPSKKEDSTLNDSYDASASEGGLTPKPNRFEADKSLNESQSSQTNEKKGVSFAGGDNSSKAGDDSDDDSDSNSNSYLVI